MSAIYNVEPPTAGKIVLKTTYGDLDIELWPKEAPLATRNFTQLCMEGYYDGSKFHRVIRNFMVQGGDPTSTGTGGSSVYGRPFKDEFHSRLLFRHRGLVACVNENKPDSNGSQFFITLDRADHLNKTATIFGKVVGDTIHNLSRFNEVDTDESDRPEDPIYIEKAIVLVSPMEGIAPRKGTNVSEEQTLQHVDKSRRLVKNSALMSFDEDEIVDDTSFDVKPSKNVKVPRANSETTATGAPKPSLQHTGQDHVPHKAAATVGGLDDVHETESGDILHLRDANMKMDEQSKPRVKSKKTSKSLIDVQRYKYVLKMKEQKMNYGSKRKREHDTLNRIKGFATSLSKTVPTAPEVGAEQQKSSDMVVTARLDDILHE